MDFSALPNAGLWLVPLALVAGGVLVAARLRRDHRWRERRAIARETEIERLQDEAWRLADSEELYRSLVEAQRDVIVQRGAEGTIAFANDGFARLAGRQREALIGSHHALRVVETGAVETLADGTRLVDEAVETPDGVRWFAWIEAPVVAHGDEPQTVRSGRDVTERVVSERALDEARGRAEAASEAKSRFLATVSHEFRTPLNGILGMADLTLDTPLSPEQGTYVHAIKTSGEALLSLIDEILDFSKIEAGRIDLSAEPFDLAALVQGVVELLAPRAQGKGIEIAAFVAPEVPARVVGDADRLRQVLVNLAGNAVKFTDAGGVGVTVKRGAGDDIVLAVADTGPGIAGERVPALFEEFERGDGTPGWQHGGTGLGLAITRRIVARMKGSIEVASEVGRGSTFEVRLPLPADGLPPARERDDALAGQRMLIVADSPFGAPFMTHRLEAAGATVTRVAAPREALEHLQAGAWDVLIVDCALGGEAARAIAGRARGIGVKRRLILLSPFDRREFGPPDAAGYDSYLVKPVRPRSLVERLTTPPPVPNNKPEPHRSGTESSRRPRDAAPRVLLAEDNQINALLALKLLEKLGAGADWAKDGEEAVALAEASLTGAHPPYDLMLLDIRMPRLDGLEAARRIRQLEEVHGRDQPGRLVALTANALKEDREAAEAAGFDGFLAKPFDRESLIPLLPGRGLARAS